MKYQRPTNRASGFKQFNVGTHEAKIIKVDKKKSKSDNNMFKLLVEGRNGEKGNYYLTFGTEFTDESLSFLIASIEDAGTDIPDIDFGYNVETFNFLRGKDVFIEVENRSFNGELKPAVTKFLTLEEFENSVSVDDSANEDW
ncbi:type III secretion system protein PrgE [Enterococcus hirae]